MRLHLLTSDMLKQEDELDTAINEQQGEQPELEDQEDDDHQCVATSSPSDQSTTTASSQRSSVASTSSYHLAIQGQISVSNGVDTLQLSPEDKRRRKMLNIAKELVTTEESFVDQLKLLNEDYRKVAYAHLDQGLVDTQLLPFLPQIQVLNKQLLQELQTRLENYEQDQIIAEPLARIGPFLKQYSLYMKMHDQIKDSHLEVQKRFPSYVQALKEFEGESMNSSEP